MAWSTFHYWICLFVCVESTEYCAVLVSVWRSDKKSHHVQLEKKVGSNDDSDPSKNICTREANWSFNTKILPSNRYQQCIKRKWATNIEQKWRGEQREGNTMFPFKSASLFWKWSKPLMYIPRVCVCARVCLHITDRWIADRCAC